MGLGPTDLARSAAATAFGGLAVLRGGRSLHPNGLAFRAAIDVEPEPPGLRAAELFRRPRERAGIIRLSRSLGLPEELPDIYGAALRVEDAYGPGRHQDLMLVTGGEGAAARHLFSVTRGYRGRTLSTVLPYRVGGGLWVFLLRARDDPRLPGRLASLADVGAAAREGVLAFDLSIAPVLGGPPRRLARVRVLEPLEAGAEHVLRFNSDHTGGGLEPALFPNRLRPAAYRASQAARGMEGRRDSGAERRGERAAAGPPRATRPGRSPRAGPTGPRSGGA